jgi:hypothetical protein
MTDDHAHEHEHEHAHDHDHEHEHEHQHEAMSYEEEVEDYRLRKDAFFGSDPQSPIPAAERPTFTGLPYFPVDERYRLEDLPLLPYAGNEPSTFQIPTSDGQLRPAHRAGTFEFFLYGAPQRLTAYVLDGGDPHSLFLPFLDPTSGRETYGAGRYLDLEPEDDGTYVIDFNLAYHPSCVYAPQFSCPLTPAENRLSIPIEAGERLAEGAAH